VTSENAPRHIAFFLFPRITALDFVGVYDGLRRIHSMGVDPSLRLTLTGTALQIPDDSVLTLQTHSVYAPLDYVDLLVIPGGHGTRPLQTDETCLRWLRSAPSQCTLASVCTGALLLGAAGFLDGKRATTHHNSLNDLAQYGATAVTPRVVDEGRVVTAGGGSSALDLGLHLVTRFWGQDVATRLARQMEYERAPGHFSPGV